MSDKKDYSECMFNGWLKNEESFEESYCGLNQGGCGYAELCIENTNCYYKQLQQAQQENARYKEALEKIAKKCSLGKNCESCYTGNCLYYIAEKALKGE